MKISNLLICLCAVVGMMTWQAYAADAQPKRKVLFLTKSGGYVHEVVDRQKAVSFNDQGREQWRKLETPASLSYAEQVLTEIGPSLGGFDVTCTQDSADINADNLKNYDAVVFYTSGDLGFSSEQKQAFLDFVRNGKGFIGVHAATDTYSNWPEYGELVGGYFDGHPWHQKVTVKVEDTKFPAAAGLGNSFEITDEMYQFKTPWSRDKLHVVMSLDNSSIDTNKPAVHRADKDFGVTWEHNYGKGRALYISPGHRAEVWRDPRYQKMIVNGIRWAIGDL